MVFWGKKGGREREKGGGGRKGAKDGGKEGRRECLLKGTDASMLDAAFVTDSLGASRCMDYGGRGETRARGREGGREGGKKSGGPVPSIQIHPSKSHLPLFLPLFLSPSQAGL